MIRQSTIEEGDILLQKDDNSNWICTKVNTEWVHTGGGDDGQNRNLYNNFRK